MRSPLTVGRRVPYIPVAATTPSNGETHVNSDYITNYWTAHGALEKIAAANMTLVGLAAGGLLVSGSNEVTLSYAIAVSFIAGFLAIFSLKYTQNVPLKATIALHCVRTLQRTSESEATPLGVSVGDVVNLAKSVRQSAFGVFASGLMVLGSTWSRVTDPGCTLTNLKLVGCEWTTWACWGFGSLFFVVFSGILI